jgi:hypothetical protein
MQDPRCLCRRARRRLLFLSLFRPLLRGSKMEMGTLHRGGKSRKRR